MKTYTLKTLAILTIIGFAAGLHAEQAPEFAGSRIEGGKFRLSQELNSGPLLLHFWDSCCIGCREALPAVQAVSDKFGNSLRVIGVATDTPKTQSKIKPFLKTNRYTFEVLLDPNLEIRRLFGGTDNPLTILISNTGEILLRRAGAASDEFEALSRQIDSAINPLKAINPKDPETH